MLEASWLMCIRYLGGVGVLSPLHLVCPSELVGTTPFGVEALGLVPLQDKEGRIHRTDGWGVELPRHFYWTSTENKKGETNFCDKYLKRFILFVLIKPTQKVKRVTNSGLFL